ncbi:MAG: choice-of-anchor Q domain-containing protein, partial [Candidatus Sulfomarinibacteraceae bacterium]
MKTRVVCGKRPALTAMSLAPVFLLVLALAASPAAAQVTLNVVDGSDGTTPVTNYRWLVEKDLTYHVPFVGGEPQPDPFTQAVSFHRSYMPVVAEGLSSTGFSFAREAGDYYYVSVLPTSGYTIGGALIGPDDTEVTVYVNPHPIPTAQIVVQVCEDVAPINNVCDPGEQPLEGFEIIIEDAGGRYGMSAGLQSYDIWGNPLGTTYLDNQGTVDQLGSGINTDANGMAYIKNLAPGKYGVIVVPPAGQGWQQTSTIEGKKIIDAWVKANEPPYFAEFGPPGPHAFVGFVRPFNNLGPATGSNVSGQVVNLHMSRPPEFAMYAGGPFPHTNCWVGLNEFTGGLPGAGLYAEPCGDAGFFTIPDVPPGEYQLVVWDANLDLIFNSKALTVQADGGCNGNTTCNLGPVPTRQWFARMENWVFMDYNGDGRRQCVTETCNNPGAGDEPGIPEQAVNLRWRDGTMYQSFATDLEGFVPFDEVFPFFSWLVAEVDFARFNATGATIYVDDGGSVPFDNPNSWEGNLNPQDQSNPIGPDTDINNGWGGDYGDARTDHGVVLTEAFQAFLGQTLVVEWGKAPHAPGSNGGISGVVFYSVTRAEDDPRYGGAEPWEPGIPGVEVNLYDSTGTVKLATTTTDSWDETPPTDCKWGNDGTGPFVFRGRETDCYDGMRVWNQVRPGIFDGGYAFDEICDGALQADGSCVGTVVSPIPSGRYVVEVVPPAGYQIVKSQDKNVDFGDEYNTSPLLLPPECVGDLYEVPAYLSLNSTGLAPLPGVGLDELVPASLAGEWLPTCDRKQVAVSGGNNAAADFFLFTQVPISAHAVGFILDDTANEFDPNSPQFGEKYAPPFLPVSIRDWTGREIGRTYSDEYGRYNFVGPSTWTNALPQPSGMSPNMLTTCMNAKLLPDGTADPMHNPQYSQFCYTFQYMPGSTVYLDTPVVPVAAFTGADQFPLDCEYGDGTPRVASVTNTANQGPWVASAGQQITITSQSNMNLIPNPEYQGVGGATPKLTDRDYSFGCTTALPSATIGGVAMTGLSCTTDAQGRDVLTGTVQGGGGQLVVTRADNGISSINAVTVQVGLRQRSNVITVPGSFATIQDAIDGAGTNDLILVAPKADGSSYQEMVIMWKPVQLQGWGEDTKIDAVKAPPEALLAWRQKAESLVTNGDVTLLPGQEQAFGGVEPAALWTEEGAGVLVLPSAINQQSFSFNRNKGARIDGFTISGADTGGGIILNGYASDMRISNNRIINNSGQYAGGIRVGHPNLLAEGNAACGGGTPLCYPDAQNDNVVISHNYVGQNGGISGSGGGVSICNGAENYALTDNYICGNFNMDQGGGVAHYGYSAGDNVIARNTIVFNDSFKQTPGSTPAGGGLLIAGKPPVQGELVTRGSGNVLVDSNLFLGNAAEAGDGGGIRLQAINGADVDANSNNRSKWHSIEIVNNMIANNLAALAGGGISIADAKNATIRHNTIANNDSTATAGNAFPVGSPDLSDGQLGAGIAARRHTDALLAVQNTGDADFSDATLEDNIVWHNRTFRFTGTGTTVDPNLGTTWFGLCPAVGGDAANCDPTIVGDWSGNTAKYSDIAVLGSAGTLTCSDCIVSDLGGSDPAFVAEYATGSRVPTINQPEQQTIFTPAAFDEGGNFIRLRFGPLTRWDTTTGALFGDYHIEGASPAIDAAGTDEPATDFDGDARPDGAASDIGADEYTTGALKAHEGVAGNAASSAVV